MKFSTCFLTILTPTYNRKHTLPQLYKSLCAQICFNFQWLIIDDGSTDGTEAYIRSLKQESFAIDYYKKDNGGKHTALNFSHPYIKGELVAIVDSDDTLLSQATQIIEQDWLLYKQNSHIGGLSYQRQFPNGTLISMSAPKDTYISDHIHYRINQQIHGDQFEVIRSSIFQSYQFPIFSNEHFLTEIGLWMFVAKSYQMVYRNLALYQGAYLQDGLTHNVDSLLARNPLGTFEYYKAFFCPPVNMLVQLRMMCACWRFGIRIKWSLKKIANHTGRPFYMWLVFPLAVLLYFYKGDYKKI